MWLLICSVLLSCIRTNHTNSCLKQLYIVRPYSDTTLYTLTRSRGRNNSKFVSSWWAGLQ